MEWLNYNHLYYFWMVAREGSIVRASEELLISQPTISAQIKALEATMRVSLFRRVGRRLALTDIGRTVFEYSDDMFSLAREMTGAVRERSTDRPLRFVVGVSDALPKLVARSVLTPMFTLDRPVHLVVREYGMEQLLIDLASHRVDIVLSDSPTDRRTNVRIFDHLLGESGVSFFAVPPLAKRLVGAFPKSLDGAPMFLPAAETAMSRSLNQWFARHGIRPKVLGEFDDSALLGAFGEAGRAVFPAPSVVKDSVRHHYGVRLVGSADGVIERYYAISVERKLKHPAVLAIIQAARQELFEDVTVPAPAKRKPRRG